MPMHMYGVGVGGCGRGHDRGVGGVVGGDQTGQGCVGGYMTGLWVGC